VPSTLVIAAIFVPSQMLIFNYWIEVWCAARCGFIRAERVNSRTNYQRDWYPATVREDYLTYFHGEKIAFRQGGQSQPHITRQTRETEVWGEGADRR
jgi:hypothetical protein